MTNISLYFKFVDYTALLKSRQSSKIIENHVISKIIERTNSVLSIMCSWNHYCYALVYAHDFQQETLLQFVINAHDMVSTMISIST